MRTTIDLPDSTLRQLKARAALDGVAMKDLVRTFVEKGLAQGPAARTTQSRSPLPTMVANKPLPIKQPTQAGLMALLDQEEAEKAATLAKNSRARRSSPQASSRASSRAR
jgi:hypothetical protein